MQKIVGRKRSFSLLIFLFKQIVDGNSKTDVSNRREPGMFCGEAEQPQTFISETSYVKVVFHTDNFTDQVSGKLFFFYKSSNTLYFYNVYCP